MADPRNANKRQQRRQQPKRNRHDVYVVWQPAANQMKRHANALCAAPRKPRRDVLWFKVRCARHVANRYAEAAQR